MAHDAFISYSSKDKPTADAVCASLEANGVRCWIAPRDIRPGQNWGESIVEAIAASRVLVLVFSTHADRSPQVMREVERAVHKGVIIIPFRIEDILPTGSMEYFLSTPHWLDALTPPIERHIQMLMRTVQTLLGADPSSPGGEPSIERQGGPAREAVAFEELSPDAWSRPSKRSLWNRFLSLFDER